MSVPATITTVCHTVPASGELPVVPTDIAEVAAFLASPGRWVNGQTIYANGGAA